MTADWSELKRILAGVTDRLTLPWEDLERISGGLPPSAYDHPPYWKGMRSGWPGFTTTDVRVGHSVTFVRKPVTSKIRVDIMTPTATSLSASRRPEIAADVVLVGCVKSKLSKAARAKDLYVSALFRKQRAYAEASGSPWFILSAEYGLLLPDEVIEPYERRIVDLSREERESWGLHTTTRLASVFGPLDGAVIEVHAGSAYVDSVREQLTAAGARIHTPLDGLSLGQRLAWYTATASLHDLVQALGTDQDAVSPATFVQRGPDGLKAPGLYSWWVDEAGALDLAKGLDATVSPGLIYAGLAGATRTKSGRRSTNTLWGRIEGMHLGSRHEFSTFRLSLGSVLAETWAAETIDEAELTQWMHEHLRVVAMPVQDDDSLEGLETELLKELDPPLNLSKMPKTEVRQRLSALRKRYSARDR